jgi:hypothetical protein
VDVLEDPGCTHPLAETLAPVIGFRGIDDSSDVAGLEILVVI